MRLFSGTPFDRPPVCNTCGRIEAECTCPPPPKAVKSPEKQTAKLAVERRKAGRIVTLVKGLLASDNDLSGLLKQLKDHCGSGGTLSEETIELQGDQVEKVAKWLRSMGYKVKP